MISVFSEIKPLKKVLVHTPGEEINNLTPTQLGELLFDDIPWLPLAVKEHQAFVEAFQKEGVEVLYLVDLVEQSLKNKKIIDEFIEEYIQEADIKSQTLCEVVNKYLHTLNTRDLIYKCINGIKKEELPNYKKRTLSDFVSQSLFIANPMPNLYFTRDPFASIGNGVAINQMYSKTRNRETLFAKYIFKYHDLYKDTVHYYDRDEKYNIEGGDILVLNEKTLVIGISQRTSTEGATRLAKNLLFREDNQYETVLAFSIPSDRSFMHLDTVLTQVDYTKFIMHGGALKNLEIYKMTKNPKKYDKLIVKKLNKPLKEVFEEYLGSEVTLIPCGGSDQIDSAREQWSDGSNCVCVRPGVVICYERNEISNQVLEKNGIKVIRIPSSELSRGRGGPRCMSMPLEREL